MQQSTSLHVAIIMDGNGRWATRRGLPRPAGHRAGAAAVRRVVEAAPGLGIGQLTLFAFSADNWRRPPREVAYLMRLFARHLRTEAAELTRTGVRLEVIGRRDRLAPVLVAAIAAAERATAGGTRLRLRLAVDYSGRAAIRAGALLGGALVALALKQPLWARRLGWLEGAGLACYALLYLLTALTSHDRALGLGEEKHICEVDCHLAYAVTNVRRAGDSLVVTVRVRFDSLTISEHRPRSASLTPNGRVVLLEDGQGRRYPASADNLKRALIPGE